MSNLTEQEKADIAESAMKDIVTIMAQYELPADRIIQAALIAAYQAGLKRAADEFRKIEL
jgi:hypothetical protein